MKAPSEEEYLAHISYDSVVFGFSGQELKILIMEYHNTGLFALPGGFVRRDQSVNDAVKSGLKERTGLDNIYLEQFHTFGSLERYDPKPMEAIFKAQGESPSQDHWLLDRFISIAYYALINYEMVELKPDELSDSINWYPIDNLPPLIQDHREIVDKALETLRSNLERSIVGMNLLPKRFTMGEFQKVYEAILGKPVRRTSFQRRMLSLGFLNRHEKQFNGKSHRAPYLYSFQNESKTSSE